MQAGANGSAAEAEQSRWLSYSELAEARKISTSSAIKLVQPRGWRGQKDNHGTIRALVPPEWSAPAPGKDFDPGAHVAQAMTALELSVSTLRERAEAAERAASAERERADRAVQARDAERARANTLRDRIDSLQAELREAEAAMVAAQRDSYEATRSADALRQIDARWRALGRLGRLLWACRSQSPE